MSLPRQLLHRLFLRSNFTHCKLCYFPQQQFILVFPFQMFSGNWDRYIIAEHRFARTLNGRYFRVYPLSWYSYVGMRVEFYGCVYGKKSG